MFSRKEKIALSVLFFLLISMSLVLAISLFTNPAIHIVNNAANSNISIDDMIDGNEDWSYRQSMNKVPNVILRSFEANEWTFKIDRNYMDELGKADGLLWGGATNYAAKEIVVGTSDSIVHEFGHYLDWALGFPKCHKELYANEAKSASFILGTYATTNEREYFAEYFEYWIEHENNKTAMEELRTATPETYKYFQKLSDDNWGLGGLRWFFN